MAMGTTVYNPTRFCLLRTTPRSSRNNASSMHSFSRSFFSLRGGAHAQPSVRVRVRGRTRTRCTVVRGELTDSTRPVSIVTIVGEGSTSPLKSTPWEEVMQHTANRLKWIDEGFEMHVFTDKSIHPQGKNHGSLKNQLSQCDMVVNIAVQNKDSVDWLVNNCKNVPNIISFESSPSLMHKLGGQIISTSKKDSPEVVKTVAEAWERQNSDDIRFCILVLINSYIRPVSVLKNLRAKGLSTLTCMVKNCGPQILNCLLDSNCRNALQCLNSCSPTDQVCNYRCIASYESPNLEAFSLCVLQKHNCLELDAEIPTKPRVPPLVTFRGQSLSHDTAEDLFIGWLNDLEWSWRVIAGQNPAYDQFPCQYQLFYRGKAKGSFWYEPVFQVRTLDGNLVWRRRRYRVKRSTVPGTFYFSVLDNGVVSKEFWTIVDVAEDLSWGLFHYHGAASAAGQSYTGAVLVSPDGNYPGTLGAEKRVEAALDKCGIKSWELYMVDNCSCDGAPLGLPGGSRLHATIAV